MRLLSKLLVFVLFIITIQLPQAAQSSLCGMGCQVNQPTQQDIADILNDLLEDGHAPITLVEDEETGVITIALDDGAVFSIEAIGLMLRHQGMQERQLSQSEDGSLHMRSQAGLEVRIRAAIHQEAILVGEMYQVGWSDFFWFDGGFEVDSPAGERLCLAPDMEITSAPSSGEPNVTLDDDGNLIAIHGDGVRQRLHACAHDPIQLRDQIRSLTNQQLVFDTNGMFTLEIDGELTPFRLHSSLRQSGILDQPGFFSEQDRIYFRYRDGWEQEIVSMP